MDLRRCHPILREGDNLDGKGWGRDGGLQVRQLSYQNHLFYHYFWPFPHPGDRMIKTIFATAQAACQTVHQGLHLRSRRDQLSWQMGGNGCRGVVRAHFLTSSCFLGQSCNQHQYDICCFPFLLFNPHDFDPTMYNRGLTLRFVASQAVQIDKSHSYLEPLAILQYKIKLFLLSGAIFHFYDSVLSALRDLRTPY